MAAAVSDLDRINIKDWLLALIGLMFVVAGLFILTRDIKTGVSTLVFFGPCFGLAVHRIECKLRQQRKPVMGAIVAGGVPMYISRPRMAELGFGMLTGGTALALLGPDDNKVMQGCALIVAVTGAVLLLGLVTGFLTKSYLQFDPPGLIFGFCQGRAVIPWSAITGVSRGEIHDNQAVFLRVDPELVGAEPPAFLGTVHKKMASSQSWLGADFIIMTSTYGMDASALCAALERYASDPDARAELRARL